MQQALIEAANRMTVADLEIVYEDDDLVVVLKPAGMLMHRGWGNDKVTAVDLVRAYLGRETVHPIHRLDRATSGPVIFAKDAWGARKLNEAFDERAVEKRYLALTRGITPESGVIDHPIRREQGGERVPAVTEFRRLATFERYSLVDVQPRTGRVHQVRRHFKHLSHPLIGDTQYGKTEHNRIHQERFGLQRLALHCWLVAFAHPARPQERVRCLARLPQNLREPFERMGLENVWDPLFDSATASG